MAQTLTAARVAAQKADPEGRLEIADAKLHYLVVQPSGSKSWALTSSLAPKSRSRAPRTRWRVSPSSSSSTRRRRATDPGGSRVALHEHHRAGVGGKERPRDHAA
jgi:hypothetical protein